MPKFTSEEHRQKWIASVRATKARNKNANKEESKTSVAIVTSNSMPPRTPRPVTRDGNIVALLDSVIDTLQEDLAAMVRAKAVMERMQSDPKNLQIRM